ncbi:hypothetical protein FB639_006620, partial [Coemansia asiatica]
ATDPESLVAGSPGVKQSPSVSRRTPSVAHTLPSIRSPTVSVAAQQLNQHQQQPQQQQPQQQPQQSYYQESIDPNAYHTQQSTPHSHFSASAQPTSAPASATSSIGPPQPRYFNPAAVPIQQQTQYYHHQNNQYSYQQQQQQQSHQLGLVAAHAASASPGMPAMLPSTVAVSAAVAAAAAVATTPLNPPRSTLPPQYITPHAIPATLLGQTPAVSNSDYNMWFYSQQQMSAPDRSVSVATATAGGMVGSASVSPVSQHALASAEQQQYPIQGHFDSQMRYMAVPS